MVPTRSIPRVGLRATVHYLAADVGATITDVADDGIRVIVETDEGETVEFLLHGGTAAYRAPDSGPRLTWGG